MPNRIIHERICTSETMAELSAEEERFFCRLIVQCDDYGRFDGRPSVVRARCFPIQLERISESDVSRWMQSLVDSGLIKPYEVDGRRYIHVVTWERHQQTRAKASKYPDPQACETATLTSVSVGDHPQSDDSDGLQIPSYPEARSDTREAIHEKREPEPPAPVREDGGGSAAESPWVFSLAELTDPARGFLDAYRSAYGSKRPPKLNRTQFAQLEEGVIDLGPERLEEAATWAASQGVDYGGAGVIKAIRAARTKRQKDEDQDYSQERSKANGRSHTTGRRAQDAARDDEFAEFAQFDGRADRVSPVTAPDG